MTLQWVAVDLLSGVIVCDLPSISAVQDPFRRTLGRYETQTATLTVTSKIDPAWVQGTLPMASALIAYRGAPGQEVIQWGGIVLRRQRKLGNQVVLSLVTPEAYLDRRYAGNYTATNRDQNLMVLDLVTAFAADTGGLPFAMTTTGAGTPRTESTSDKDDATVYALLQQAMAADGGPEFTADWVWTHGPERITPRITVGSRIGNPVIPGLQPAAFFETAMLTDALFDEDYSSSKGANITTTTGAGQGDSRPQASAILANMKGRPKVELRTSTSETDVSLLQRLATADLARLQDGAQTVSLTASVAGAPQLGVDWNLGDDIGYELSGAAYPSPVQGVGRCIGYELDDTTVTPILYVPEGG